MAGSLAFGGAQAYGNLRAEVSWAREKRRVEQIAAQTPPNAVIILEGRGQPSVDLFLGRTFVRQREIDEVGDAGGRPRFLLCEAKPGDRVYEHALATYRLVTTSQDQALFDLGAPPRRG